MVVHRPGDVSGASDFRLDERRAGGGEEERGGGRGAQGEDEGAVWAHGDAGGDGSAGDIVRCAGVEFL